MINIHHETFVTLSDIEDVLVTFTIESYGNHGSSPSWNHPGDPPEPPEFEIVSLMTPGTDLDGPYAILFESLTGSEKENVVEAVLLAIGEIEQEGFYYED